MNGIEIIYISLIGVFAFFLKGIIGTGPTTVIVSLGSLVIEPKSAVVLSSLVNIFGGLAMLKIDPVPLTRGYWWAIAVTMIVGSIIGAMALKIVSSEHFQLILGIVFLLCSFWFLLRIPQPRESAPAPTIATRLDLGVGTFAGFCGGFVGINAPPLILHFSRYLSKSQLRRLLVLIFLPAALAQSLVFAANGMLTSDILLLGLCMLPAMVLGIFAGNLAFHRVSEVLFRRVLGVLLIVISGRLLLKAVI